MAAGEHHVTLPLQPKGWDWLYICAWPSSYLCINEWILSDLPAWLSNGSCCFGRAHVNFSSNTSAERYLIGIGCESVQTCGLPVGMLTLPATGLVDWQSTQNHLTTNFKARILTLQSGAACANAASFSGTERVAVRPWHPVPCGDPKYLEYGVSLEPNFNQQSDRGIDGRLARRLRR
jgi:hypothetical protein